MAVAAFVVAPVAVGQLGNEVVEAFVETENAAGIGDAEGDRGQRAMMAVAVENVFEFSGAGIAAAAEAIPDFVDP